MQPFHMYPLDRWGDAARLGLLAQLALHAATFGLYAINALGGGRVVGPDFGAFGSLDWATVWVARISVLSGCVMLFTAAAFIGWMRRAYANTAVLGGYRRYATSWAVIGWFVPFGWFVFPYQILAECWHVAESEDALYESAAPNWLMMWWGAFWLAPLVPLLASYRAGFAGTLFSNLLQVAALIMALRVVKRISDKQDALREAKGVLLGPAAPSTF